MGDIMIEFGILIALDEVCDYKRFRDIVITFVIMIDFLMM